MSDNRDERAQIDYAKMEMLGDLYAKTGSDWILEVSHILTEPTCPTATVYAETRPSTRYRADRGTIEASINSAIDMAYREQVLGERITPEFPMAEDIAAAIAKEPDADG